MNQDINIKKARTNCFRQSKVPGEFMLQMRVPGGFLDAAYLSVIEHIAKTWGDGNFHFGTRQTCMMILSGSSVRKTCFALPS